jgi:serine/threonine protein kinase
MLRREAAVLRALSHPYIIPFRDFIDVPEHPLLLVMDLAEGGSLSDLLQRGPALTTFDVYRIIYQVLQALDYVHSKSIVHLDVK